MRKIKNKETFDVEFEKDLETESGTSIVVISNRYRNENGVLVLLKTNYRLKE